MSWGVRYKRPGMKRRSIPLHPRRSYCEDVVGMGMSAAEKPKKAGQHLFCPAEKLLSVKMPILKIPRIGLERWVSG